ncbi:MAG: hypothetical protein COZ80_00970 [Ignavibacteria bacterium CG_4_8_14_3_um_filter_37_9]|nr:MAG: hypothetical protein COZ80_00970 [Ignavibacteria bacterium CG_4_8_14_3_um_filter_37_9]
MTEETQVTRGFRYKTLLDKNYKMPKYPPIDEGEIILVRFISSDRKLDVFEEVFKLPKGSSL